MWGINKLVLLCVLAAFTSLANGQVLDPLDLTPHSDPKDAFAAITENAITSTSASTSTSTSTSTVKPITTSTSTQAPKTTTSAPVTTTEPPVTTPKPTPFPSPDIGHWNTSCIMIQMAAQFNYTFVTKANKTEKGVVNVSKNATIDDFYCEKQTQALTLLWEDDNNTRFLTLQFNVNETRFSLYTILLKIHDENAISDMVELMHIGNTFTTPLQMSYHCTRDQKLNLTEVINDKVPVGVVDLSNLQFEAFRSENSTKFSIAKDCDAIDTPDIVPVAVGIALAALILVVLISYLVARNRNNARGYTSF